MNKKKKKLDNMRDWLLEMPGEKIMPSKKKKIEIVGASKMKQKLLTCNHSSIDSSVVPVPTSTFGALLVFCIKKCTCRLISMTAVVL